MNCVLIKMAGNGVRFGASLPKQFYEIESEPLFAYVLRKYNQIESIDKFIIVTNSEWLQLTEQYSTSILGDKLLKIVCGGDTNAKSTCNGVLAAADSLASDDILLIHDVTDPIINPEAIIAAIENAHKYGCVTIITEQVHTLYKIDSEGIILGTIDKNTVGSGYSPEAFKFSIIRDCYHNATDMDLNTMTSAMALVQGKGINARAVISHQIDLKITYKEDMEALISLIKSGERLYKE